MPTLRISTELLVRTIEGLSDVARGDFRRHYGSNLIDHELARADHRRVQTLLQAIIELLLGMPELVERPAQTEQKAVDALACTVGFDNAVSAVEWLIARSDGAAAPAVSDRGYRNG